VPSRRTRYDGGVTGHLTRALAIVVAVVSIVALAPREARADAIDEIARPAIRVFRDRDGLPQNSAMSLAFDSRGVLWVGTQDGLASFDGRAWRTFNLPRREVSNFIRVVFVDADDGVWCGRQDGGLARLNREGTWDVSADRANGLPDDRVEAILEPRAESGARSLWVATRRGVAVRGADGRWTALAEGQRVNAMIEGEDDGARVVWLGTDDGVRRVRGGPGGAEGARVETLAGSPRAHVSALLETRDEGGARVLWAGANDGLYRLAHGSWTKIDRAAGLPFDGVDALARTVAADGSAVVWVGSDAGVARLEGGRWTSLPLAGIVPAPAVWSFLAAPASGPTHTLWIGLDGALARVRLGGWRTLAAPDAAVSTYAFAVTKDRDGGDSLFLGTRGSGVLSYADGAWKRLDRARGLPDDTVFAFFAFPEDDGSHTLWIGTQSGGVVAWRDGRWAAPGGAASPAVGRDAKRAPGAPISLAGSVRAFRAAVDDDGAPAMWAATAGSGVLRYAHGAWTSLDHVSGLPIDATFDVAETRDPDGARVVWVATQGAGVARYARGLWTRFDRATSAIRSDSVLSLHASQRALWAGTEGGGVSVLDLAAPSKGWTTWTETTTPALPNNTVYQVQEDARGRIYLFTNKGVARITPTPDLLTGRGVPFTLTTFTTDDGLPSNEFNGGASYVDARGRIWGGSVGGATFFDPAAEIPDDAPKPLVLTPGRLLPLGDERGALAPGAVLSYDESSVAFDFTLVSLFRGEEVRYRTQLVGLDAQPSAWSADAKREYTTLPAGAYTFRVWGRDHAGIVSGPKEIAFRVKPSPWRTTWAFALYAALAAALWYAVVWLRVFTLERRNRSLEKRIAERTRELADKVDELARSESRARAAEEEARGADRAKSAFLSTMSHELRTPLNAILGFSQLRVRARAVPPAARDHVDVIQRSGEHLLDLINGVLSIAKIEAGAIDLESRVFRLEDTVHGAARMIEGAVRAKRLRLAVEIGASMPPAVRGDEGKLRQILLNLLGNAVKFTAEGGVTLRAAWDDGRATIEVEDTGPGIAKDEMGRLFAPFVQSTSGRGAEGGTGLGLVISRAYARQMGGDVTAKSELGAGTTFRCEIALPAAEAADAPPRDRRALALARTGASGPYRVLVADDTAENRALLAELLGVLGGFEVREASTGEDAVRVWRAFRPHVVFMEMRLAKMDGVEATRAIRAAEREQEQGAGTEWARPVSSRRIRAALSDGPPSVPARPERAVIVALSASAFDHERAALLDAGCDDFIAKPYREETVIAALERHLGATFVREPAGDASASADGGGEPGPLEPGRVAVLPDDVRAALLEASRAGDLRRARDAADQVAAIDADLARALRAMIEAFRLEEIEATMEGPADGR